MLFRSVRPAADSILFAAMREQDYGRVLLRFDPARADVPLVLQFLRDGEIQFSSPLREGVYKSSRILPGEYSLRILFDSNDNGVWDPGDLFSGRQPERVISIRQKLAVRADWDNERDISY